MKTEKSAGSNPSNIKHTSSNTRFWLQTSSCSMSDMQHDYWLPQTKTPLNQDILNLLETRVLHFIQISSYIT